MRSLHAAPGPSGRRSPAWFAVGAAAVPALALAVLLTAAGSGPAPGRAPGGSGPPPLAPPGRVAFVAPDGDASRIWIASPGAGSARPLTRGDVADANPSWSPDGRWLAFDRAGARGGVLAARASGRGEPVRVARPGACLDPAWSPDGRSIACADTRRGRAGIVVVRLAGAERERLTVRGGAGDRSPAWSPDGRLIAFTRLSPSGSDLFVIRLADRSLRQLAAAGNRTGSPAWSPDGRRIAYSDGTRLAVVHVDGTARRVLVRGGAFGPTWSPDGRLVAFWTGVRGHAQLRAVDPRSGAVRRLAMPARAPADAMSPAWAPLAAHGGPWAADRGDPVAAWLRRQASLAGCEHEHGEGRPHGAPLPRAAL